MVTSLLLLQLRHRVESFRPRFAKKCGRCIEWSAKRSLYLRCKDSCGRTRGTDESAPACRIPRGVADSYIQIHIVHWMCETGLEQICCPQCHWRDIYEITDDLNQSIAPVARFLWLKVKFARWSFFSHSRADIIFWESVQISRHKFLPVWWTEKSK
jgi:hypothetical protein